MNCIINTKYIDISKYLGKYEISFRRTRKTGESTQGKQEDLLKENRRISFRKIGESTQGKQENLLKENRRIFSRKTGESMHGKHENLL